MSDTIGAGYDAIVVGLGAMGSAAAYHLAKRGQRVLGLDAFPPGHARGSSHGESRIIRMAYYEHPDYVPLLRRAYENWEALERDSGRTLLRRTGGVFVGRPDGALVSGSRRSAEQYGLAHEIMDAAEVRRRFPALAPDADEVALYEPTAGALYVERCVETHLRLAREHGADLRHETPVRRWHASPSGVTVETASGHVAAQRLILTAGSWLGRLLEALRLPLQPERNVIFWLEPRQTPERFTPGQLPIFIWETGDEGSFYGVPHLDLPGVKVGRHHSGNDVDPDDVSREVTAADEAPVRQFVERRIPDLAGNAASSAVCLYTNTPDKHFVIDTHPEHANVVLAGGFSGHGFKFSSVVGEILADLAIEGATRYPIGFLNAGRLALNVTFKTSVEKRFSSGDKSPDPSFERRS